MKIVIVSPRFFPIIGGGENQAMLVAKTLRARGHMVTVLASRIRNTLSYEQIGAVDVVRLPSFNFVRHQGIEGVLENVLFTFECLFYLLVRLNKFQIVYFFWGLDYFGIAAFFLKRFGKKTLVRTASAFSTEIGNLRRARFFWARKQLYRFFDLFVAISSQIEANFLSEGIPAHKIVWLKNGVDSQEFSPARYDERIDLRRELGLDRTRFYILFCGHLTKVKGIDFLLRSISGLTVSFDPKVELLILGTHENSREPGFLQELRSRVASTDSALTVKFMGNVVERQKYFKACDLFVLPSQTEGLPNALLEAMASELPCVATRVGGVLDIIEHGQDGILVNYGDENGLREAIVGMIRSPKIRAELSRNARAKILASFDISRVVSSYEDLFSKLLGLKRTEDVAS